MRRIVTVAASRENPHVVLCMTYDHTGTGEKVNATTAAATGTSFRTSNTHAQTYTNTHINDVRNVWRHVCVFLRAVACGFTWRVQLVDSPIEPSHTGRHLAEVKKNTCERHVLGCVIHKQTVFPVKMMMMISMRLTVHDIHVCVNVCLCC